MGGFQKMLKKLEKLATEEDSDVSDGEDEVDIARRQRPPTIENDADMSHTSTNPTRWEKACMSLHGMVKQVSKVDPDGLDIVCVGGNKNPRPNIYRNVKNIKDVERIVTAKLPSGSCHMGEAMEVVMKEAFERGFKTRPTGILVLTAGQPDDCERLETSLRTASNRIAAMNLKESPLSVTIVHVGDDLDGEEYMRYLDANSTSTTINRKTKEKENIVDTIKDTEIKAAMNEIKGTKSSGTTGAIVGAFAGAAMGAGGVYLYNKNQAKKRTKDGWNGKWKATYDGMEIGTLKVNDDLKGSLIIDGFPGGRTIGKYSEKRNGYCITFRDADENWIIKGDIEDEHTIYWSDGSRWDEIIPKGMTAKHYAGAAVAGAATGGAIGYLLDKKFFKKASKKDQADYVIIVDRSAMMAVKDKPSSLSASGTALGYGYDEEENDGNMLSSVTKTFKNMDTGDKVAAGILGTAAVAGTVGLGVAGVHAVKDRKENKEIQNVHDANHKNIYRGGNDADKNATPAPHRSTNTSTITADQSRGVGGVPISLAKARSGLNGRYRATFDGDEITCVTVHDDLKGRLTIKGFMGGTTVGRYQCDHINRLKEIHFMDADEQWPVNGDVKGNDMREKTNFILWSDGTRWDRIG